MTRIDLSTAHSPAVQAAEGPGAKHRGEQDFLDHLRDGKSAEREKASRPGAPLSGGEDSRQSEADPYPLPFRPVTPSRVSARSGGRAAMDAAGGGEADILGADDAQLQATRGASITAADTVDRARVFEQHWFANGYLSFIANADDGSPARELGDAATAPAEQASAAEAAPAVASATMAAGVALPEGAASWPVVVEGPGSVTGTLPRSIERMVRTLGPLVAADQPWPERLLRLSVKPDGKASLWVRDYALPPQAIQPLVANLRQLARKEGIALERVVVNGATAWHSKSFEGEM